MTQRVDAAPGLTFACARLLRDRGWHGNDLLAEHLDAVAGDGSVSFCVSFRSRLEELASILEGDPTHGGGSLTARPDFVVHGMTSFHISAAQVGRAVPCGRRPYTSQVAICRSWARA
ncbi:MAG: hypothetical protein ABSD78_19915 [Acidimicrobiales bacterium]|jgi:hypothetical protein